MRAEQVEEGARAAALGEREALRELVQRQRETDLVELLLALEERGAHLRLLQLPPDRLRQLDRLPRAVERLGGVPLRRLELREPRMQGGEEPHLVGPPRAGDRLLVQSDGARIVPPRGDVSEQRARLDLEIGRADRPRVGEGVGGGSSGVVHPPGPEVDRGEVDLRGGELALQAHAALRMPRRGAVPHPALRHPHRVLCVAHGGVMVAAAGSEQGKRAVDAAHRPDVWLAERGHLRHRQRGQKLSLRIAGAPDLGERKAGESPRTRHEGPGERPVARLVPGRDRRLGLAQDRVEPAEPERRIRGRGVRDQGAARVAGRRGGGGEALRVGEDGRGLAAAHARLHRLPRGHRVRVARDGRCRARLAHPAVPLAASAGRRARAGRRRRAIDAGAAAEGERQRQDEPSPHPLGGRAAPQPVGHARRDGPHVARQAVGELAGEPLGGRAAVGEIAVLQLRTRGELSRARAAAGVAERRVDDDAAPAGLTHGERQVAVVAVEEPVALVDPAHRLERRAAQAEADAIDDRDLLPRRAHGRALGETVDDRAAGVAAVAADPLDPVQSREPDVRRGERRQQARQPRRLEHGGVVVQETDELGGGQPPGLVVGSQHRGVGLVARVAQRPRRGEVAEQARRVVGGAVVDDDERERLVGRAQALEAGARRRRPVVHDHHDAGARLRRAAAHRRRLGGPGD